MPGTIHIFGGGTVQHVRNHFALCAPAYGTFATELHKRLQNKGLIASLRRRFGLVSSSVKLHLTKMADRHSKMETNEDVAERVKAVLADPDTRAIVFNVALCDYSGQIGDVPSGKYATRLSSRDGQQVVTLTPADKVLKTIRSLRPDVLIVGFKTTAGDNEEEQAAKAWRQIKETGVDLVWVNDTVTRANMLISSDGNVGTPDYGTSRSDTMDWLVDTLKHCVS